MFVRLLGREVQKPQMLNSSQTKTLPYFRSSTIVGCY